ncbi:MAG: replication-relaxation family protein [Bdellovibrionota bacterium]
MIELQERDLRILKTTYENQILSQAQVARFFFQGRSDVAVRQRLSELEKEGFIKRRVINNGERHTLVRLSKKSKELIEKTQQIKVPEIRYVDQATLTHDLAVTGVRLRLEELWDGTWIPERALKCEEFSLVPDGIFRFESGNYAAIEIENSRKDRNRMHRLLSRWALSQPFFVLYVALSEDRFNFLKDCILDASAEIAIGVMEFENLNSQDPQVWSPSGTVHPFSRRSW